MVMSNILSAYHCQSETLQALPPDVQEKREIEAIMNDPRRVELLSNAAVLEIRKVKGEQGPSYILITDQGQLQVDVHYLPLKDHICGPAQFELVFHQLAV